MTAEEVLVKHEVFKTADKNEAFNLIFHRDAYRKAQSNIYNAMIEFAQYHVKKALEKALDEVPYGGSDEVRYEDVVGILKCYPKENIK